ncbi:hypothetical protein MED121_00485 [Marinomonas sp. MED121]|nr:hypothetical protein MED121_00485 [Marinomonas sp. MED121]
MHYTLLSGFSDVFYAIYQALAQIHGGNFKKK